MQRLSNQVNRFVGRDAEPVPASFVFRKWQYGGRARRLRGALIGRCSTLTPGNRAQDDQRLLPRYHRIGQWSVWRLMRQILLASEEAQEGPTLLRDMVADRPPQHRIAGLKRVEDRAQRGLAVDLELYFTAHFRQRSQMLREFDPDHFIV